MFNAKRLLDQFLGGQTGAARLPNAMGGGAAGTSQGYGGLAQGALIAGVAGLLLGTRTGRRIGGGALRLGGLAAVSALAYKAYRSWQAGAAAGAEVEPAPAGSPFANPDPVAAEALSVTLLTAMIAAAKADGVVDEAERGAILGQLDRLGLDPDDRAWLEGEFAAPLDIDALARAATSPEVAAEIYTASLMVITADTPAERGYLALLAARLRLPPDLAAHLDATVRAASV